MMPVPEFLKSRATGRNLVIVALFTIALGLLSHLVLAPIYRGITGFAPFELQSSLSKFMIAVELGALAEGAATKTYISFAAVDLAYVLATALLFTLFWPWLFVKSPTRLNAFLVRGGILLLPSYIAVLDLAAKVGFFRLLRGLAGPSYAMTVEFCAVVHRLKFAVIDIRNGLTAAALLAAVVGFVLTQRSSP